jgi:hypothetical protein
MTSQRSKESVDLARALLACGVVAGPFYVVVGSLEMLTRAGYDIRRHALSLLSNGEWGWVNIALFVTSGLLTVAGAVGLRRVMRGSRGGTWGPLLIGVYGVGVFSAGIFTADPAFGFPPGTPADAHSISWHGLMHFVSGAIGFLGLIAACFVFARRFAALKQTGWAAYSIATGIIFLAAFLGIASGSQQRPSTVAFVTIAFSVAVVLAWTWISILAARLRLGLKAEF